MEPKPKDLIRLDVWLTEMGFAPSRAKAQELISEKAVQKRTKGEWQTCGSASLKLPADFAKEDVRITSDEVLQYVSRGGRKLEAALSDFKIDVRNLRIFDVGQSTGGFTDCVLQKGATSVVGVDVGQGQLHESLRRNPKVRFFEEMHLKELGSRADFKALIPDGGFDLTVTDLSFISTLDHLQWILPWAPCALLLIKPQFELGADALNKKGLVQNTELFSDLKVRVEEKVKSHHFELSGWENSKLSGKDGNQEFFAYVIKSGSTASL